MKFTLKASLITALSTSVSNAIVLAHYTFDSGASSIDTSPYSTSSDMIVRDGSVPVAHYLVSTGGGNQGLHLRAADSGDHIGITSASIDLAGNDYFEFGFVISGLAAGETIDLTSLTYESYASSAFPNAEMGLYSDVTGYDTSSQLDHVDMTTLVNATFTPESADLSTHTEFSGLTNGDEVYFRFYQADGGSGLSARINMIDNVVLNATINSVPIPEPSASCLLFLAGVAIFSRRKR